MSQLYVVYALDHMISAVKADSKDEALDIFAMNLMEDENLNYFIKDFALDDGLLSSFSYEDQYDVLDIDLNDYYENLTKLNEPDKKDYINSRVERKIKQFWEDEPQFALEFLQEIAKAKQADRVYAEQFSDGFLLSTIKKLIQHKDWYEAFDIVEIDMADINHQVIYKN